MLHRGPSSVLCLLIAGLAVIPSAARGADAVRPRGEMVYDPKQQDWVETAPSEPGTEEGDLRTARELLARRKYASARKAFALWRSAHADSTHWPEALFHSADTEVYAAADGKSNDLWQAYTWYEEIVNGWAGTEWSDRALRRELVTCEMFLFKGGKRRVFKGLFHVSAVEEALNALNKIIDEHAPKTRIAEQALRMQADYHFQQGEFAEAERAYARLARDFPRGAYERLALERAANSVLASFSGIDFDDAPLLEAEERYGQYADRFPDAAKEQGVAQTLEGIRDSRAQKEFRIGRYYERVKKPSAAIYYYRYVVRSFPNTIWAGDARNRLVALGAEPPADEPGAMGSSATTQPAAPDAAKP